MNAEKMLDLDQIRVDGETQARAAINRQTVGEYAEAILRGEKFPPVEVYFDGKEHWLSRGFHRWHAHRAAQKEQIACVVHKGTKADAAWYACGDNISHGLRRTNADIECAVRKALAHANGKAKTNAQLAAYLGVSENTIKNWRDRTRTGNPHAKTEDRRHPQVADGRKKTVVPQSQTQGRPGASASEDDDIPMGVPPGKKAEEPQDDLGAELPAKCRPDFARRDEVQSLMTQISEIKTLALKAHKAKDPLFADLNPSAFQAECENVYRSLRALKPYATCPYCGGKGCRACLSRGWVGEFVYAQSPAANKGKKK